MSMQIVSYGAGTNSTAMLVEMVRRGENCDAVVFSDTGGERPETYEHVLVFSEWLASHGYPTITAVANDGMHGTLEAECLTHKRLPAVAYGFSSCSDKYKRRPFKKWLKAQAFDEVTVCIGFDADEPHRAERGASIDDGYQKRYPLIEWNMGREECLETIAAAGLELPGKSACFFCPNSKKHEIFDLRDRHPQLLARALAMEGNAELSSIKGLGRSYSWGDLIRLDAAQGKFDFAHDMPCGCYDG